MESELVLVHTPRAELVGTLLQGLRERATVVAYDDAAELVAAARKADVWLVVLDLATASQIPEGVIRRLRNVPSHPELIVRPPAGYAARIDLPDDGVLEPAASDDRVLEQSRRLLDLQQVRRASGIVGSTPRVRELLAVIAQVAPLDVPVLVQGESGTGKEMVARALHSQSRRRNAPFVSINVGSLAETLLESELFGHEKGAFTGAARVREGKFESADGGTLLLDEITEMDLGLQVKLLRVLQEREVERLGSNRVIPLNVRVIATTNRDLAAEVAAGRFREDLYYRLNVFPLHLPPLRERPGDIEPLALRALSLHARGRPPGLAAAALRRLRAHPWPGNVRELDNVIQRALVLSSGVEELQADDLFFEPSAPVSPTGATPVTDRSPNLQATLEERECDEIVAVLREEDGHRGRAAERLGISPRTLRYKLSRIRKSGVPIPGDGSGAYAAAGR